MSQVHGTDILNAVPLFFHLRRKLREVIRRYDIDLVHAYWAIPSGFVASLVCGRKPLIITLPGSDIKLQARKPLFRMPVRYSLKRASWLIARSEDTRRDAIGLGADGRRVSIIPAGVDTNKFKPGDKGELRRSLGLPDGFLMLFAGSLLKVKRVDLLIDLCARLGRDCDCHLVIAGDGQERASLETQARALGLKNVLFRGRVSPAKMPLYTAAADVLVLASESEGLPGCAQEAIACGVPVVASSVGGLPEIVTNGVNGYLADSVGEMENRLRLLIGSPSLAAELGRNALEYARGNLSFDLMVNKVDGLYRSLLEGVS
jgi:glycosyltransferase involved in cell wall biosynthesis